MFRRLFQYSVMCYIRLTLTDLNKNRVFYRICMWLQLSQILKKFTQGNARKPVIYLLRWHHKNQKNTCGTRMVIHLSMRHIFLAPGLTTCLNRVWNYCYVYWSDLTPFKCWQKWFSFLLRVNCVIFARTINTDVWQAMVACAIESQKNSSEPP